MEIKGEWVTGILQALSKICPSNEAVQMTVLTRALARAGKVLGLEKKVLVENLERAYDDEKVVKQ